MKSFINIFFVIAIVMVLLTSCRKDEGISEERKIAMIEQVKERVNGYADAAKRHDADWLLNSFWSKEKDFIIAGDGQLLDYDSGIVKPTRDFVSKVKNVLHIEFSNGHAYVLSDNALSYATEFDWGMVTLSGDTINSKGTWLYVFKKYDDHWKVVHSAGTHKYY